MRNSSNLTVSRKTFRCSFTFTALSQKRLAGGDEREEMNHEQRVLLEGRKNQTFNISRDIYMLLHFSHCWQPLVFELCYGRQLGPAAGKCTYSSIYQMPFNSCYHYLTGLRQSMLPHTTKRLKGISACLCCVMHILLFQSNTAANTLIIPWGPSTHHPSSASLPPAAPAELTSQVSCTQLSVSYREQAELQESRICANQV